LSAIDRYLVTGAYGCIGAWVVRELVGDGHPVVTYDVGDDPRRLRLLLDDHQLAGVVRVRGDIANLEALGDRGLISTAQIGGGAAAASGAR
jgi:nucleoside-diphosphate-sugar epimerase